MFRYISIVLVLFLIACDPERATRPIQVVAPAELVQRQSCQALSDAQHKVQEEVVLKGTVEHGRPDLLRVSCEGREHKLIFILNPPPDDLGMKALRKQWRKRTSKKSQPCNECPKYNVQAKFVGTLRADPADPTRLLYFVRTADEIHRKRIRYEERK